jgi:lactoylglutathione lyase
MLIRVEKVAETTTWPKGVGAITLFVDDLQRSRSFYQDVFDVPVVYEDENSAVFRFENTLINLLTTTAARELIEPGTVASRGAGSRLMFSIWVADADAVCADLDARGVKLLDGPVDREWGKRTASFADPDGNIWEIAQQIS